MFRPRGITSGVHIHQVILLIAWFLLLEYGAEENFNSYRWWALGIPLLVLVPAIGIIVAMANLASFSPSNLVDAHAVPAMARRRFVLIVEFTLLGLFGVFVVVTIFIP